MKIAMPYLNGQVNAHFGSSREFVVIETENGKVTGKKILTNEILHKHGGLASMLSAEGVGVIITGGIGRPMAEALQRTGLQVISGASGEVEKVALDFLSGQLVTGGGQCNCGGHH
jgi:predicted Fe-Mo cluster-binding NifX family protein